MKQSPAAGSPHPQLPRVAPVPLALVQHANQYLITDGYADREGLTDLLRGYSALLDLHERHAVALNLHLSGTLVQAAAWHDPAFLARVAYLRDGGLVTILGGTYSENVMPLFPDAFNRRQLDKALDVYRRHLGCAPEQVQVGWVPERVWDSDQLAPLFTACDLANGGYRAVLLDDRLFHGGEQRAEFDRVTLHQLGQQGHPSSGPLSGRPHGFRPRRLDLDSGALMALPMSTPLRYWMPPRTPRHWSLLDEELQALAGVPGALLVCADDMEKSAGVGPWDPANLGRYDDMLAWIAASAEVRALNLSGETLGELEAAARRMPPLPVQPGAFLELSVGWRAGDDYRGWAENPAWTPYRLRFDQALSAVERARAAGADRDLIALADDHLLATSYETAWHDLHGHEVRPAPWARALASHSSSARVIVAAAEWFAAAARPEQAEVRLADLDGDGSDELVLCNDRLFAVITPRYGGRLVSLFARTADGCFSVVGNPSDDWNWQEEVNRHMDRPAAHPGGFRDVGAEHVSYDVFVAAQEGVVRAELTRVDAAGARVRKTFALAAGTPVLAVEYDKIAGPGGSTDVQVLLSPDYRTLLRDGRAALRTSAGPRRREASNGRASVWVEVAEGPEVTWHAPPDPQPPHGFLVQAHVADARFTLLLGSGPASAHELRSARDAVRRPARTSSAEVPAPRRPVPEPAPIKA